MPSTSAPFGLRPVYHPSGLIRPAVYAGGIASAYGTAIYQGSPVTFTTAGVLNIASAAADWTGVFAGCSYVDSTTGRLVVSNKWVASTSYVTGSMVAVVYIDPDIVYEIQADGAVAQTAIGDQADFTNIGTGNATTGLSSATISSTLAGAGVQGQLRIIDVGLGVDNAWGDTYTVLRVMNARHQYVANKVAI